MAESPVPRDDKEERYSREDDGREREFRRERDPSRERGHSRHREDRERDYRDRDREGERPRDRERDRRYRDDDRRHRDDDYPREERRSRGRSRSRSRSRSPRDRRRNKRSGFDMAPPGAQALVTPGQPTLAAMPGAVPQLFPFTGFGAFPQLPVQAMTQQATRHARRVYVGGLPPMANEQSVATFFSQALAAVGGNSAGVPGDAVVNVYINQEKKFAFVELRTVEEASNCMALDGINYEGVSVRVRRPSDYNPSAAAALGPSHPNPSLNLSAVGLTPGAAGGGADGPDRIFVGGLPYYLTEEQIKELLSSFGPLRAFDLVKDRDTGNSKGYGFCVYQDTAVTDIACAALNGMKLGDKTLTVRRATASGQPKPDQTQILQQAQQQIALQKMALVGATGANAMPLGPGLLGAVPGLAIPTETPTRVVCLNQVVSPNELTNDEEYEEILDDMRDECGKYGTLVKVMIPRPDPTGMPVPGLGKVYVEYVDTTGSQTAKNALNGRKFGGNTVVAAYYPEERFSQGDLSG